MEDIYTMDYGTAYVWHKDDTGYAQTGSYEVLSLLRRCVPARRRRRMREQGIAAPRQVGWAFDDDETQLCLISEYLAKYVSWEQGDMQHVYVAKGIQHQIHIGGILVELEKSSAPCWSRNCKGGHPRHHPQGDAALCGGGDQRGGAADDDGGLQRG